MKGTVLTALLGLCVALAVGQPASVAKDFNFAKFSGFWYEIAFATKEQDAPPKIRKLGAVLVEPKEGNLVLTTSYEGEAGCVKDKRLATKGNGPGKFKLSREFGDKDIWVLVTDYTSYAIMNFMLHQAGRSLRVLKLYVRDLEQYSEALKKFRQVALDYGLSAGEVHLFTWDRTCVDLLQPVLGGAPSS